MLLSIGVPGDLWKSFGRQGISAGELISLPQLFPSRLLVPAVVRLGVYGGFLEALINPGWGSAGQFPGGLCVVVCGQGLSYGSSLLEAARWD